MLRLLFDRPNNRITNEHAATRVDINFVLLVCIVVKFS